MSRSTGCWCTRSTWATAPDAGEDFAGLKTSASAEGVPGPPTPGDVSKGQGTGPAPGPTNIGPINVNNNGATPDQNGTAITWHLGQAAGQSMFNGGR